MKPVHSEALLATLDRCFDRIGLEREKAAAEAALRARNEELEQINQRLRLVVQSMRGLTTYSKLMDLFPRVLEEVARNMAADGGSVYIVDERDQVSIGRRYWGYGEAAKITTGQDVAELIRTEVVSALNSYSFEPVTAGENIPLSLKIEVRRLEYRGSQEFTFGLHVFVTLKANARNGDNIYEKLYRVEKEDRVMIVADAETNARLINATLSDAISQMVNDSELLAFLAQ